MAMSRRPVGILPLGEVPELVVKIIAAHVPAQLQLCSKILSPLSIPPEALDQRRCQYDAGMILKRLESLEFEGVGKVLALLAPDLFIPVFSHVFGEARQGGKMALISLHRLAQNPGGSFVPASLFYERAAKIALHEIGHLFDLFHCSEITCLMHFSGDLTDLDRSGLSFCRYCSACLPRGL